MPKDELKQLIIDQENEKNALIRELIDRGIINKRLRANKDETNLAYQYVLETADDATKALQRVSIDKGKENDWVDKVRHSPVYKTTIDNTIKVNKDHPVMIDMNNTGVWNKGSKRSIKQASTLSSMLNTLSGYVNLHHRVENLEYITQALVDHAIITDERISKLENKINTKEKALTLLNSGGYNVSEVAKMLGKHRNTIAKWKKEADNDNI